MDVNILQLNCQGSYAVWNDLNATVRERGFRVVAVPKPPAVRVSRIGWNSPDRSGAASRVGIHVDAGLQTCQVGHVDVVIGSVYLVFPKGSPINWKQQGVFYRMGGRGLIHQRS